MAPGKRKSPFIGAIDTASEPILYKRYTDTTDILLEEAPIEKRSKKQKNDVETSSKIGIQKGGKALEEMSKEELLALIQGQEKLTNGSAAHAKYSPPKISAHAEAEGVDEEEESTHKASSMADQDIIQVDGTESTAAAVHGEASQKKKKKKEKGKKAKVKAPSGPSNADEADKIRTIMGITKKKTEAPKPTHGFSFGFQDSRPDADADIAAPEESDDIDEASVQPEAKALSERANPAGDAEGAQEPSDKADCVKGDTESAAQPVPSRDTDGNSHLDAKLRRVLGQEQEHVARRIFVGGMPFTYDEDEVREYWSYCGEIEEVDLMRFPDTGRFKGIAFVTFAEEAGYKEALKYNGEFIDDHKLKVEPCVSAGPKGKSKAQNRSEGKQKPEHTAPAPKTPGYHVAYVGNLVFEATPKQLREVFKGCEVTVVRLHTDKVTGKSKGYAHVHFANEESLDRAVEANGTKLLGRPMKIGYAQPKKE